MTNQDDYHYIPPDDEIIDSYSKKVCDAMNETDNPEVALGFAGFVSSVARAYANLLNQNNGKDNPNAKKEE